MSIFPLQTRKYNKLFLNSEICGAVITNIYPFQAVLSREHTYCTFVSLRPFFEEVYHHLFPFSKQASMPKPWRINFILETVYGARILMRDNTKLALKNSKYLQYGTLINLLDNYLPLVLSIYTITFKKNNFPEYCSAMIRTWVMFMYRKRRYYNKSSLVWLSCTSRWGKNYTFCCSLPENILSLTPTSNSLTQKDIHFIQLTSISVDTQPFASKGIL